VLLEHRGDPGAGRPLVVGLGELRPRLTISPIAQNVMPSP